MVQYSSRDGKVIYYRCPCENCDIRDKRINSIIDVGATQATEPQPKE